jgi:hypothetical protein
MSERVLIDGGSGEHDKHAPSNLDVSATVRIWNVDVANRVSSHVHNKEAIDGLRHVEEPRALPWLSNNVEVCAKSPQA